MVKGRSKISERNIRMKYRLNCDRGGAAKQGMGGAFAVTTTTPASIRKIYSASSFFPWICPKSTL